MTNVKSLFITILISLALGGLMISGMATAAKTESGDQIVRRACTSCHTLQRVRKNLGKRPGDWWERYVSLMQQRGAKISNEERKVLVKFLSEKLAGDTLD